MKSKYRQYGNSKSEFRDAFVLVFNDDIKELQKPLQINI